MKKIVVVCSLAAALTLTAGFARASEEQAAPEAGQALQQEQVYGAQIMTPEERAEYRTKMRSAKTAEERMQLRQEHHEMMKERAKERGFTLPEEAPVKGGGMGQGPMGPGGMGQGGGRNR